MTVQRETGDRGEALAREWLISQGYTILQANFRCKHGEIDLVAQDADTLVFIEVKHYKSGSLRTPYEAVSRSKQRKIIRAAQFYLMQNIQNGQSMRFDVILFENGKFLDHLKGAFFV